MAMIDAVTVRAYIILFGFLAMSVFAPLQFRTRRGAVLAGAKREGTAVGISGQAG
jgi:hypothetical protein